MKNRFEQFIDLFNDNIKPLSGISFGIFLFILFFQPFPVERFDFNDKLLFVAGFGAILFLFMFIVRVLLPWIWYKQDKAAESYDFKTYMGGFLILLLSSVAFSFYLRYVGSSKISFYIIFRIFLICFAASVILRIYDADKKLRKLNMTLLSEKNAFENRIEKYEENLLNKTIEFFSDNKSEILTLHVGEIAFVRSADNYVEIVYKVDDVFRKSLIRNTLKNIEIQLKEYPHFIRCHRICLLNKHYIEKLNRSYNNHWITIKGYNEKIPVSRQYLLKVKEVL